MQMHMRRGGGTSAMADGLRRPGTFGSPAEVSLAIVYENGNKRRKEEAVRCGGADVSRIHGSVSMTERPGHNGAKV